MANTKVYVNTDSSGGTDGSTNASGVAFPTLDTALTYAGANKVASDIWTLICSAPSGALGTYTGSLVIADYAIDTDATGYLHIRPNRGNEGGTIADQRHYGVWDDALFRLSTTLGMAINQSYVRVTGLQVAPLGSGSTPPLGINVAADHVKVERCLIRANAAYAGDGSAGSNVGIYTAASHSNSVICNCVVHGFNISTAYVPGLGIRVVSPTICNITVVDCRRGAAWVGVGVLRNILINGSVTNDFDGAGWNYSTVTNCASEDATAPGSSNRVSQTFTFVNAGGFDYRITSADTGANDFGVTVGSLDWTDVDSAQNGPVVTIDEITRTGTWSIGASEGVVVGGGGGELLLLVGEGSMAAMDGGMGAMS